jgi:hypothetical protein
MVKRCGKSAPRGREVCGRGKLPRVQFRAAADFFRASARLAPAEIVQRVESEVLRGITRRQDKWLLVVFRIAKNFRQNPAYECHLSKRCLQRFERFLFALVAAPAPEAAVDVIFFKTAVGTFVMVDFVPVYVARKNAGVIIFRGCHMICPSL